MSQLPVDCLNEIFECLEEDKSTLHSCLLVNRLWCEVSVRILWKSVLNCNTLIACLSNESKEILHENGIIIPTPTSKPPLFNYIVFIKNLEIDNIIKRLFKNYQSTTPLSLDYQKYTVTQEIYKSLMNQISSLRELHLCSSTATNITFTIYPGAIDCLEHLFHLSCHSDIYPGFFYQLSQICHNIQSLDIKFENVISNGLKDLISVQKNLKYLNMDRYRYGEDLTHLIPSLTKHSNTLIKLNIYENTPLSFVAKFTNLQELVLSFDYSDSFEDFKTLQYVTFPQLRILKFPYESPSAELLIKFLENNGKTLNEFYVRNERIDNNSLNIAVAKFCPNLRKLNITFNYEKFLETLKMIFNNCQYLESIKIWSGYECYLIQKVI